MLVSTEDETDVKEIYDTTWSNTVDIIRLVPVNYMRQAIRTSLVGANTVFVSPLPFFDSDWQYFLEAKASNLPAIIIWRTPH